MLHHHQHEHESVAAKVVVEVEDCAEKTDDEIKEMALEDANEDFTDHHIHPNQSVSHVTINSMMRKGDSAFVDLTIYLRTKPTTGFNA